MHTPWKAMTDVVKTFRGHGSEQRPVIYWITVTEYGFIWGPQSGSFVKASCQIFGIVDWEIRLRRCRRQPWLVGGERKNMTEAMRLVDETASSFVRVAKGDEISRYKYIIRKSKSICRLCINHAFWRRLALHIVQSYCLHNCKVGPIPLCLWRRCFYY